MANRRNKSHQQKLLRQRRNERPFIFDSQLTLCLGAAEREPWEQATAFTEGDVAETAEACGLKNIPRGAKILWGRSAEEALGIYRRWQKQRKK